MIGIANYRFLNFVVVSGIVFFVFFALFCSPCPSIPIYSIKRHMVKINEVQPGLGKVATC